LSFADGGSAGVDYVSELLPHMQRASGCSQPVIHDAVALEAICRETLCLVIGRFCLSKVVQMATHALSRQALPIKWPHGANSVTGIAVDRGVRPDQRESVLMLIDVVDRHLPAGVAVAQIALSGILAAMNVGVAVLALITDPGEHEISVAVLTTNTLVHATQRKARFAMIKFENVAKRFPPL
jgi:hypothetical protein